jgi:pilus assembly protein CpaF
VTREHWAVNIRKFPSRVYSLEDLVELGSLSVAMADYLTDKFSSGVNALISGATQAGKTTMLCALLNVGRGTDRLVSVEETFEIRTNYIDWVAMQARQANLEGVGEINLRRLVKEALRMRPDRLVIGEVRQAEALDLLIALNSGIAGLCTIHANSAYEALDKLKLLPLLAGENIPAEFVSQTVERTIGLVIQCEMDAQGKRRVAQVICSDESGAWVEVKL